MQRRGRGRVRASQRPLFQVPQPLLEGLGIFRVAVVLGGVLVTAALAPLLLSPLALQPLLEGFLVLLLAPRSLPGLRAHASLLLLGQLDSALHRPPRLLLFLTRN